MNIEKFGLFRFILQYINYIVTNLMKRHKKGHPFLSSLENYEKKLLRLSQSCLEDRTGVSGVIRIVGHVKGIVKAKVETLT